MRPGNEAMATQYCIIIIPTACVYDSVNDMNTNSTVSFTIGHSCGDKLAVITNTGQSITCF